MTVTFDLDAAQRSAATEQASLALHQLFERQVEKTPDVIALVHRGNTLTYQALNQQANQLAHYLIGQGVKADQLIGISVVRSPLMLVAFLGVLKAGAAYVPIDPDYPEARRAYILADAQVGIVLTERGLVGEFVSEGEGNRGAGERGSRGEGEPSVICLDDPAGPVYGQPTFNPDQSVEPDQLAYVIYTSGSTGNPKGVMAHHRGLVNYSLALADALGLTERDRMLQFSTMSFDFIVSEIYPTLARGGSLALRTDEMVRSTQAFLQFIEENQVTVIQFTTAFWHELVNGIHRLGITLPECLRLVLFGGEKASLKLCRQWMETVGDYPRLFNAYGPTEATVITTLYDAITEGYDGSVDLPIGRAINNAKTYVLDEQLQPVPADEPGELCIGGPGVTRGYLNLPEKTDRVFCDDPFVPGGRLYRTGDLVEMDDTGLIQFVGRVDFQVKIRGYRIELGEIEACLDQYPPLQSRIVIAREDTPGDKQLVAYVVMQPGQTLDRADLNAFMKRKLPAFMVPAVVVVMDALPKNANGKIDRPALPRPTRQAQTESLVAPATVIENKLVQLWKEILTVDAIGVTDNFFELGGTSLLVMRLFSQLEADFGCQLPLTEIFAAPTIRELALKLMTLVDAEKEQTLQPELIQLVRSGDVAPPLFLVHDADGDTGLYIHLARWMVGENGEKRAIYAIAPRTSTDAALAHSRIENLAKDYIQQIQQVQPNGPYLLGGLCAGGIVAFEMSLQLEAMGKTVMLTMLDAPAPGAEKQSGQISARRLSRLNQALGETPSDRKSWVQRMSKILTKGANALRYEVRSRINKGTTTGKAIGMRWYQDRDRAVPTVFQSLSIRDLMIFMYEQYKPAGRLQGPVLLVRASNGNGTDADRPYVEEYADPVFDWQPYCEQAIATYDAAGGHSTMLAEPQVAGMAEAMEKEWGVGSGGAGERGREGETMKYE